MSKSAFLVAAASSGSGKTTITLGLLRALRKRGVEVQPFKCGPDYIDPHFHEVAAGRPSINLDSYFAPPEHLQQLFSRYSHQCDVSIAEGVMGLLDGYDRSQGSSAEIAAILGLPILLVMTPKAMAHSAGAILYGLKHFQGERPVVGVIFNQVRSESHYQHLARAAEDAGVTPLGYLPKDPLLAMPSRHLGLVSDQLESIEALAERAALLIEERIDLERLLQLTLLKAPEQDSVQLTHLRTIDQPRHIAIARDEAFTFLYQEQVDFLKAEGEVTFFSPIADEALPEGTDFLYLPGGYPELHLSELSGNKQMLQSVRAYIEGGGACWAECGGMMYLSRSITGETGQSYPMVGVFPQDATMEGKRLTLGYRTLTLGNTTLRGHEFHYSRMCQALPTEVQQYNMRGEAVPTPLLRYKRCYASYTHLYWSTTPHFLDLF